MDTDMPEHKWFYFKHGKRASNLEELKTVLESIDESEFKHHVSNDKNDFANWVEDVFGEQKLASSMREAGDKEGIIILLDDFLSKDNEPPAPLLIIPKEQPRRRHKREIISEENKLDLEPEKELSVSEDELSEKELSEKEIKALVNEAMLVFDKSEAEKADEEKKGGLEIVEKEEVEATGETEESEETDAAEEEWVPEHKSQLELEKPMLKKGALQKEQPSQKEHHKFMVEEFLYGFIMGLIFGLIMLGVILQLRVT